METGLEINHEEPAEFRLRANQPPAIVNLAIFSVKSSQTGALKVMKMLNRLLVEQQTNRWKQTTRYTARYSRFYRERDQKREQFRRAVLEDFLEHRPFEFQRTLENCSYLLFAQVEAQVRSFLTFYPEIFQREIQVS